MPGIGLIVRVVDLGSQSPNFKSYSAVELRLSCQIPLMKHRDVRSAVGLIPGGVHLACQTSDVSRMSASMRVYCVGVATRPGLCSIAKETTEAAPTLCTEYGPNGWIDGISGDN